MSDNNNPSAADIAQLNNSIGKLTGAVETMHGALTARIADIRSDIARMETAHAHRMDRIETNVSEQIREVEANLGKRIEGLDKRIDGLGTRVTALEAEDKKLIEKTAKLSAVGGGVGGALAAVLVELIKRY